MTRYSPYEPPKSDDAIPESRRQEPTRVRLSSVTFYMGTLSTIGWLVFYINGMGVMQEQIKLTLCSLFFYGTTLVLLVPAAHKTAKDWAALLLSVSVLAFFLCVIGIAWAQSVW